MACFIPQNIAMQKKKNRKFWTWRYSFLIDRNNNGFSIETPLFYHGYIEGNDLGNAWELSDHIIRTRSGIVPPKTAIYCGPHCGKLPSINATYASHGPTIMSGAVLQKSDVTWQACPP